MARRTQTRGRGGAGTRGPRQRWNKGRRGDKAPPPHPGLQQRPRPALPGPTGLRRHVWAPEELGGGACEPGRLAAGSWGYT